jgi:hypothetical protein
MVVLMVVEVELMVVYLLELMVELMVVDVELIG